MDLGLVGHELGERATQPQRLGGQLAAARVALVEDEVDDREHRDQPVGQQVVGRDAEGDAGTLDLRLRAHEPLGHRRLGDEEGASDLGRAQAAERAQRQRDLRLDRERRVTAGEDELESLVGEGRRRPSRRLRPGLLREPRAGGSSPRACDRGGCGRSRGCAPSSAARRPGCPARRRAASARRRSRRPPARPLRRARNRRGSRSARRAPAPSVRGTTARGSLSAPRAGAPRSRRPCYAAGMRLATSIAASRSSAS